MQVIRRIKKLAAIFAVTAILAGTLAINAAAVPIHCPLVCMDVPFFPYFVCWHQC